MRRVVLPVCARANEVSGATCGSSLAGRTKAKGAKKRSHTVAIGTAGFSISGDETKTVKLDISATGRALLGTDHGHLSASLAILELPPSQESTLTKAVWLIQQQTHIKRSR
jgi:hypothetical protein